MPILGILWIPGTLGLTAFPNAHVRDVLCLAHLPGVDDDPALIPLSQSCFSTKRSAPNEPAGSPKTKKQKVLHGSVVDVADNNLEATSSDGPVLSSLVSAMDCDRRSKQWFMGDHDYVEYAFVGGGSEMDQKFTEKLMQNRAIQ